MKLEEQLVKANRNLELIMQLSEAALWSFTLKDRSVRNAYVSEVDRIRLDRIDTTKMTGFVQGMESLSTPPGDQQVLSNAIQACVDGETPEFQCEYRILRGDGAVRWRQARGIALRAPDGTPTGFMATSIDVTDLKRAEEEARTIKERLELALRHHRSSPLTWKFRAARSQAVRSRDTTSGGCAGVRWRSRRRTSARW